MTNIQDKALIVSLTIRQWSARKFDRKATKEVEDNHNTTDVGRFNKVLIAQDELGKVGKLATAIRTFHYENTLAWSNNTNERILAASHFLFYSQGIGKLIAEFDSGSNTFSTEYPYLKAEAKTRLNGLYNEADYPHASEIRSKFEAKVLFSPVPDTEDFRVSLSADEVEGLKKDLQLEINNRISEATRDIWDRVKSTLTAMVDRLGTKDAIFRDSLVNNVQELVALLPKLNLTGDPNIDLVCKEMNRLIVSPDSLRSDDRLRAQTAKEAQDILNKVSDYF